MVDVDDGYQSSTEQNINNAWEGTLNFYEDLCYEKEHLLLQSRFPINSTYSVYCGLSPTRDFTPTINIVLNEHYIISLAHAEWDKMILHLQNLMHIFRNDDSIELDTGLTIRTMLGSHGTKIVILTKNYVRQYFSEACVEQLISVNSELNKKLDVLYKVNLLNFYLNMVDNVHALSLKSNFSINPIDTMTLLCKSSLNLEAYCILELIDFNRAYILADLYRKRL